MPPETPNATGAAKANVRARLAVDRVLVGIGRDASCGRDGGLEVPYRFVASAGKPDRLGSRCGDRGHETHVTPGESALRERRRYGLQLFQPATDAAELLDLSPGEAEALARVVVEADEAEAQVRAAKKKWAGETTEHAAGERFLTGEAPEKTIEEVGAEIAVDTASLLKGGRDEKLWSNQIRHRRESEG